MRITFHGAAREVTGSRHLIETNDGKRILLDCGVFQGKGLETDAMNRNLAFSPASVDHIILTHAHIDHSGLIPYLVRNGFDGSIICTNATRDLCAVMLADSGRIQERDTHTFNKKRVARGLPRVEPLYTYADAVASMKKFIGVPYNLKFRIDNNLRVLFTNTGHMLGSAAATLEIREDGNKKLITYTGDIGRPNSLLLRKPDAFPQSDILITESTYGDRLHSRMSETREELLKIVYETCVVKGGKLIIPAFSVGRTQEVVYTLNNFYNENRLPRINIYVDSPLSMNATNVFRLHSDCFNKEILEVMETDPDPFGFNSLFYINSTEESKRLNELKEPCIIISSSGMMEAGRVKHHLANNLSSPNNTVLAVGYCAPSTLGARLLRGDQEVSIHGVRHTVRAEIKKIDSFSGHGDYREMIGYLSCQDPGKLKQVFLVHGEYLPQITYREHLKEAGFSDIEIPSAGQTFEI
jgi:metallo-beta-lactamase family protein